MTKLTAKQVKKQGTVILAIHGSIRHYVLKTETGYKFLALSGTKIISQVVEPTFKKLNSHFTGSLKLQY